MKKSFLLLLHTYLTARNRCKYTGQPKYRKDLESASQELDAYVEDLERRVKKLEALEDLRP